MAAFSDWSDLLCCPACKSSLRERGSQLACTSCKEVYPIVDGIPVLLNEANSLFPINDYVERKASYFPGLGRLGRIFVPLLPELSANVRGAENYERVATLMRKASESPRVLVLGGGNVGQGMERLLASKEIQFYETDVTFGPRTKLICDAHDISFKDGTFDCVTAQAVLEHVADPYRCVQEIHRVLKPCGIVYVEIPFMQQVHLAPYDFHRFTFIGLRRLMRQFDEIDLGTVCGPGMALAWAYEYFLLSFVTDRLIQNFIRAFARCTAFWLKYFDYYLVRRRGAINGASALYFIGRKTGNALSEKEVIQRVRSMA